MHPPRPTVRAARSVEHRLSCAANTLATSKPSVVSNSHSNAAMQSVRPVRKAFFPLDEELGLLPGRLTPLLQDHLAHLGTWMPFAKAAAMLERFTQVSVSESSAQRHTEAIGIAYEAVQLAEVEHI